MSSINEVKSDWVDVTCSAECSFVAEFVRYIKHLDFLHIISIQDLVDSGLRLTLFGCTDGGGQLRVEERKRFHRVSISGGILEAFRVRKVLDNMLFYLGTVPHRITRLDACLDVPVDGADSIDRLSRRYPDDQVCLTRKALRVTRLTSARASDGRQTGTWYAGHRSRSRITARVYDKAQELVDNKRMTADMVRGLYPRGLTRYELTFRDSDRLGCTLRDVSMPRSLFYQYASPTLVPRPDGFSGWSPDDGNGWLSEPLPASLDYERLKRMVEESPELDRLQELAASVGSRGRLMLLRELARRLHVTPSQLEALQGG